jgi:hypothetical protein
VDLGPFRAAIAAGVDSMMSAHVAFPALDPEGNPATLSPAIMTDLLRRELGFTGIAVTDALIMEGVHGDAESGGEPAAAVRALAAGCDALLYPNDPVAVAAGIRAALADGRLAESRVREAIGRVEVATARASQAPRGTAGQGWGSPADEDWSTEVAIRSVHEVRGTTPTLPDDLVVVTVDDDVGGPYPPPSRDPFPERLRKHGRSVETRGGAPADALRVAGEEAQAGTRVVALYSDIRAWKGRPGLSAAAIEAVARLSEGAPSIVCLFGHPRLAAELEPSAALVVCAWGGEELMQRAAADWLTTR